MVDSAGFFGDETAADPQGYDGYGRYLLDADGKGQKSYTRATTLAKTTDDGFGLKHWEVRKVAKGVAMSPALTARAAIAPLDDKPTWKEIVAAAEVKSGGDEKRDLGSAFHELHERVPAMTDEEYAAVPHDLRVTYERYRAELDRLGIVEVLTEGTCVNTAIGVAGKFDAVFRLADGRLVIGDRKSGRVTEYPHSPCQQFAIYANADVLITWDDNGAAVRQAMPAVDREIAIVVDITIGDENTAAVHVYEADIAAGWYGALLSAKVRRWRNRKDLLTPYQPELTKWTSSSPGPAADAKAYDEAQSGQAILDTALAMPPSDVQESAAHSAEADAAIAQRASEVVPQPNSVEHAQAALARREAGTHPAWSSAQEAVIDLNADGTAAERGPIADGPRNLMAGVAAGMDAALADVAALLAQYKTKAQLQSAARVVDPQMAVNRTRNNLAADIVSHANWPGLRSTVLPGEPTFSGRDELAAKVALTTDQEMDGPTFIGNTPADVPSFMTAAEPVPDAAPLTPEDELLQLIGEALTTGPNSDLAAVWDEAQQRGVPWSPRLNKAAELRNKVLKGVS